MSKNISLIIVGVIILGVVSLYSFIAKSPAPAPVATTTPVQVNNNDGMTQTYSSIAQGFSIRLPDGFTTDESYKYQALGPSRNISGVKFTIAPSMATGTNLSKDSYISVEKLPESSTCQASEFLSDGAMANNILDGNTRYSVASSSDAGAGNRYEETVYSVPGTNPCIAIRYFIHYAAFENFPTGAVVEFNKQSILNQFDLIRRTFKTQ